MIISCPYCKSNYKIEENHISKNGRKVKCYNCANFWIQFSGRKFIKLKSEDSFSTELARRQNLIRNSLSKKNINIKNMEHGNNLLSKEQEKELLSSLAIAEIEQNQIKKDNSFYYNNVSINRVESIKDKLNSKEEKNSKINIKFKNKSYLGFIIVSFMFIMCFLFYQKPEIFVGKNTKFEQELLIIIDYIDILITNLIYFIEKQLIK